MSSVDVGHLQTDCLGKRRRVLVRPVVVGFAQRGSLRDR